MMEHPKDGELVQLLDGSLRGEPDVSVHVKHCARCQTRLGSIETRSARLGLLLRQTDRAVPDFELRFARHRQRHVVLAAAVAMLLIGGFSVEPVRAWIFSQGRTVWQSVFDRDRDALPALVTGAPADTLNEIDVGFRPQQSTLRIDVRTRQTSGSIVLRRGGGPEVTATITDATAGDGITVFPHGLRIENSMSSAATYIITIPPLIEAVEIRLAGETASAFRVGPSFREDVVDIRAGARP